MIMAKEGEMVDPWVLVFERLRVDGARCWIQDVRATFEERHQPRYFGTMALTWTRKQQEN